MKTVNIIGIGIGDKSYLHQKSLTTICESDCLIGAKRMMQEFSYLNKDMFKSINSEEIYNCIVNNDYNNYAVLVSGDTGFYSLSKKLTEKLKQSDDIILNNIPAIGSLQYFVSKLNLSWDNIKFISAHGKNVNIISNVMFNKKVFMLTGGEFIPNIICKMLTDKGLGHLKVSVGENLSYPDERIIEDTASNISNMSFESLSVIIVHNDDALDENMGLRSIGDEEFITGKTPMTKSEVRTISIGKLNLKKDSVVYDIGAGTGSVSIEIALKLTEGALYAIEKNTNAVELIKRNIKKFKAYNIETINNNAINALENLPKADSAFIGGSSGSMDEIIKILLEKNNNINLVINTITLQSLQDAIKCIKKYKFKNVEIINVSVSKSKKVGNYDMMMGQNPIYIISAKGSGLN